VSSDRYAPFDVVSLREGIPEAGLPSGTEAVVLDVYEEPIPAYEVEVVEAGTGRTLWSGAIDAEGVDLVWSDPAAER
jgi:hypothetical protein